MNKLIARDIASIETDIARYTEIVKKNSDLKAENNKMEYFINRIKDIENSTTKTSDILTKINSYVPKEITFMSLSFSNSGSINITGESDTYNAIPEFLANLEMSEEFRNVTISYINPIEKTIEVSTSSKENTNLSTRNTLLPVAMTGSFDIWEEIVLVADALNENSDSNNTNGVGDGNWINGKNTGGNSNNTNSTGSSNSTTITNTVTKYSFSISIEGVSKDGSKAKETE